MQKLAILKNPKLCFALSQIMILMVGEIAEACSGPPPCLSAFCSCAIGGGLTRAGVAIIPAICIPFIEPCSNSADLCTQCFSESGCPNNSSSKTVAHKTEMTCERKSGNEPITCRPGDHRP